MTPREIHDPETLLAVVKECDFMCSHATDQKTGEAYKQMRIAAGVLRDRILGRHHKYLCPACNRQVGLCANATYRFHFGADGKRNCTMAGKPLYVPLGYEYESSLLKALKEEAK